MVSLGNDDLRPEFRKSGGRMSGGMPSGETPWHDSSRGSSRRARRSYRGFDAATSAPAPDPRRGRARGRRSRATVLLVVDPVAVTERLVHYASRATASPTAI